MKQLLLSAIFVSGLALAACGEDTIENPTGHYLDAKAAYDAGSFFEAERLLLPIAEDGHVDAQFLLSDIYLSGKLGQAKNKEGLELMS